jgi:hypothetical protein
VILEITMLVAISPLLVLGCVIPASAKLAGASAVRESAAHSESPFAAAAACRLDALTITARLPVAMTEQQVGRAR